MALHGTSSSSATQADHRAVLPFAQQPSVTAKPSTDGVSTNAKDKPASSAAVGTQQVELLVQQHHLDGNTFSPKTDPVLGQAAYVNKPSSVEALDGGPGADQLEHWKSLVVSTMGSAVASHSADDVLPVTTATASTGIVVPSVTSAPPSALAIQQRLLFQKLVAAVKSSHGTEQQQLLKMMARTNPQLLGSFIKQVRLR